MAYTTSAKAKSPVHKQKFTSIKHEQVLADNAMEDFVNCAWFGSASSNVFPKLSWLPKNNQALQM